MEISAHVIAIFWNDYVKAKLPLCGRVARHNRCINHKCMEFGKVVILDNRNVVSKVQPIFGT